MEGLNLDNWIYKDITYINTTRKKTKQKKNNNKKPLHIFRIHPKRPHIKNMNDNLNLNSTIAGVAK
jgi:hypothetical protein